MGYFSDVYGGWEAIQLQKYEQMTELIEQMKLSGKKVLDVGCGTGSFERFLESLDVDVSEFVGIDPDKKMMEHCKMNNKLIGRIEDIELDKRSFDSVVCIDVLHLVKDIDKIKQALKSEGFLLLALFCNELNIHEKRKQVLEMFHDFTLLNEKVIEGKEKELVFLFQK